MSLPDWTTQRGTWAARKAQTLERKRDPERPPGDRSGRLYRGFFAQTCPPRAGGSWRQSSCPAWSTSAAVDSGSRCHKPGPTKRGEGGGGGVRRKICDDMNKFSNPFFPNRRYSLGLRFTGYLCQRKTKKTSTFGRVNFSFKCNYIFLHHIQLECF